MYMDGFLIPVRDADKEAYRAHEAKWWPTFRDMGARALVVGWGDDVPPGSRPTSAARWTCRRARPWSCAG